MRVILSLLPVLAFWLLEETQGTRAAIVAALVLAGAEVAWTRWRDGRVSRLTLASAGLVAALGGTSLLTGDDRFARLAPALGDLAFAAVLAVTQLTGRSLLLAALAEQEPDLEPHPLQVRFLTGLVWRLVLNLLLHAVLVVWAIGRGSDVWTLVAGPVQLGMLGAQILLEIAWARLVVLPRVEAEEEGAGGP